MITRNPSAIDTFAFLMLEATPLLLGMVFLPTIYNAFGHVGTLIIGMIALGWFVIFPIYAYVEGMI